MDDKIIESELQFKSWFINNFASLGYTKILKDNKGKFPDFIMLKSKKEIGVELETLSSNFILHRHDPKKVDELVCIKKDVDIPIPTLVVKTLEYESRIKRISATVDPKTLKLIDKLLESGKYRNKSHVIEKALELLEEKENEKKK